MEDGILSGKSVGYPQDPSGVLKGGWLESPSFRIFGSIDDFRSYKLAFASDFPLPRLTTKGYIDIQSVYKYRQNTHMHTCIYIYIYI